MDGTPVTVRKWFLQLCDPKLLAQNVTMCPPGPAWKRVSQDEPMLLVLCWGAGADGKVVPTQSSANECSRCCDPTCAVCLARIC